MKELEKRIVFLETILKAVSHDVRSPLLSASVMAETIIDEIGEETKILDTEKVDFIKKYLSSWGEQCSSVLKLTDNILSMKNLGEKRTFFLEHKVSEAINPYLPLGKDKEVKIRNMVDKDIFVRSNPDAINLIVRNLIANAIKFTKHNGTVKIIATEDSSFVSLSVVDNGVGIAPERIKNLFEKTGEFSLGTNNEKGFGIGLSLVKYTCDVVGFEILAESEGENKGSTFTVKIPKK